MRQDRHPASIDIIFHKARAFVLFASALLFSSVQLLAHPFPLAKGNAWYYSIVYFDHSLPPVFSSYTFKVLGDSLMLNGRRYWVFDLPDMFGGRFIRSDSAYVYYWQYNISDSTWSEKRVFPLHAVSGTVDTINWGGFLTAIASPLLSESLFTKSTGIQSLGLGGLIFADISIADDFGYSYYDYKADSPTRDDIWTLRGCVISDTLYGQMTDVRSEQELPERPKLHQNFPNPFNLSTSITFSIPHQTNVLLQLYDVLGREVMLLLDKSMVPGTYTLMVDGTRLASGIYFYRIEADSYLITKKLVLLK